MQPNPIDTILSMTEGRNFDAALRELERLRGTGCPKSMSEILNAYIQYWRTPGAKTGRELIRLQVDHGATVDRTCLYGWMSLTSAPALPSRLLRGFAKLTVVATGMTTWDDAVVLTILDVAGQITAPEGDRQFLFDNLAVPMMEQIAKQEQFDLLLKAEAIVYEKFIKQPDTEQNFGARYKKLVPCLRAAGVAFGANHRTPTPSAQTERPRVIFFAPRASRVAHIEALCEMLKGYRGQPEQPFEPLVLFGTDFDERVVREIEDLGITVMFTSHSMQVSPIDLIKDLRRRVEELNALAAVFVSVVNWMAFAFAARIAPVQVWLSLKYHHFETPEIDAYLTGGQDVTRMIDGRLWHTFPLGIQDWFNADLQRPAEEIRRKLGAPDRIILGTVGREEKLRNPAFLEAVCTLLKRHPNCIYLWTGRTEDPVIAKTFARAGLQQRVRFIGWVDTKLYAQVFDIFLDSFPAPAGFTAFQAMAAAKPVVLLELADASQGVQGAITKLYRGEEGAAERQTRIQAIFGKSTPRPRYLLAATVDEYISLASTVIADVAFRREAGAAGQTFMNEFVSNTADMGAGLAHCISAILAEKLPAAAAPNGAG